MLIFFDIDGTLVDEKLYIIPESAKQAIRQARANGHICMINTGRSGKLVGKDITDAVEFDGYLMGCGTYITYHGEVLLHKTFTEKEAKDIIEGLHRHHIDAVLEGNENNYCDDEDGIYWETFRKFIHLFDHLDYGSYEEAPGHFDKFYTYAGDRSDIEAFQEEFGDRLDFVDRGKGNYEITPKGFSKASAMEYIAEYLKIPMQQTAALGDSSNDIPMIECAHVGIAMGNASDVVKAVADYVTTDIMDNGIENALRFLGAI